MDINPRYREQLKSGKVVDQMDYLDKKGGKNLNDRFRNQLAEDLQGAKLKARALLNRFKNAVTNSMKSAPRMTKGQQELQDWRNHRASQVQAQIEADAKAGGKAMRGQVKGANASRLKPPSVKGNLLGRGNLAVTGLSLLEMAVANSGTEYGNKVKAAGEDQDRAKDDALAYGKQFFNNLLGNNQESTITTTPASTRPKASGTVITIDGKRYDTGYHAKEIAELRKKYPGGGNAGQSQSIDSKAPAYIPLNTENIEPPTPTDSGPKLDPNATEQFKTAFNAGNNNMAQIQAMYADGPEYKNTGKTALQLWAEANPALAQKEYLKKAFNADGTPKILDKTAEGFDKPDAPGVVESINGSTLQNPISINTLNEVLDKSEAADDSQEFLKEYIATGKYLTS